MYTFTNIDNQTLYHQSEFDVITGQTKTSPISVTEVQRVSARATGFVIGYIFKAAGTGDQWHALTQRGRIRPSVLIPSKFEDNRDEAARWLNGQI